MSKRLGLALVVVLLVGVALHGQECSTQSYLVSRGTAEAAQGAIVQTIDGATRSLDVAVSSFADGAIGDAVVRAAQRGISVRVILPVSARTETGGQYAKLTAGSMPLKLVPAATPFSYRFAVIDGATVISGTYEWAGGTNQTTYGTLTVIRCGSVASGRSKAEEYAVDFSRFWDSLPGMQAVMKPAGAPPVSMLVAIQEIDTDQQCVLLFNRDTVAADLGGWVITDSEGRYVFPQGFELAPGELYHLCIGELNPVDVFLFYLDPEHDELYLIAPDGTLVDQIVW
ncbi:MAG: phospholipase D-like domain-containing protein [Candidatus Bipolaricaulota bacterium]|nr:phospholipase D-like domain-containing protein [Candidatus Bipolaricaulota bacterium]